MNTFDALSCNSNNTLHRESVGCHRLKKKKGKKEKEREMERERVRDKGLDIMR